MIFLVFLAFSIPFRHFSTLFGPPGLPGESQEHPEPPRTPQGAHLRTQAAPKISPTDPKEPLEGPGSTHQPPKRIR